MAIDTTDTNLLQGALSARHTTQFSGCFAGQKERHREADRGSETNREKRREMNLLNELNKKLKKEKDLNGSYKSVVKGEKRELRTED